MQAVFLPPVQCLELREVLIAEKIGEILGLLNLGEDIAPVIGMQFLEKRAISLSVMASRMKIRCSIVVLQSKISEGQEVWTLHTRCINITDQSFLPEFAAVRG